MKPVILDGAMGTLLQQRGLPPGERPEVFGVTHPQVVESIHRDYLAAGAQVLYTNTFGANAHKLAGTAYSVTEAVTAAVTAAKRAAAGTGVRVALDVGPLGELLVPAGLLSFEDAYALFREMMTAGAAAGADLIVIETMTDLYEVKAAVLAAKENTGLPVFVTMSFEESGRTFTGCSLSAMALTLEGLGVDALGMNCSLGPDKLLPLAKELRRWTGLPLIIKPNAGLPDPATGAYSIGPKEFAALLLPYLDLGFTYFGGCCGTSPAYITALRESLAGRDTVPRDFCRPTALCSPTRTVMVNGVTPIGERINPTGKKRFKQALLEKDMDYILRQGLDQTAAGAMVLDVNVGTPGVDEPVLLAQVVTALQSVCDAPLQLDSAHPEAIEAALRLYNGKPLVNSVNGDEKVLHRLLPVVKKYGAAVVGLTLDEDGIPETAEGRLAIARRIVTAAEAAGIPREDVYIDCLTMTVSVDQTAAQTTLDALRLVKRELGVRTVLGVSNVSFGLPNRPLVNQAFLTLAMEAGLDLPILNPNTAAMMDAVAAFNLLSDRDAGAAAFVARYQDAPAAAAKPTSVNLTIEAAIIAGLTEQAGLLAKEALETIAPMDLVDQKLIPALDTVGQRYEKGELFLPQLLQAAQAAQAAFEVVKDHLARTDAATVDKGKIVLATVKGDVHDIGKNIVKVILENYGYRVIDLGKDVAVQSVVEAVRREKAPLVGLSALMTTTLPAMGETIAALRCLPCRTMVGGAVLTADYARTLGAGYYAKDAKQAADIAKEVFDSQK